jgi:tetratricopeptide (TPR) repeat protein
VRPAGAFDRFTFAHALVRDAIVDELPGGRRARLHARIADALERAAETRTVPVGEISVHLSAAGALVAAAKTVRYARAAGDEAASRLAFDVAAEQYRRAVRAHERVVDAPEHERLDLELARGRALTLAGDQSAAAVLRHLAAAAEELEDGARMAEALLAIGLDYADVVEEDAEMVALLRRALALLPVSDSAIRARVGGFLAQVAFTSSSDGERREMVADALAMARRIGDPTALASVLTAHSWVVAGPESVAERLGVADELVAVARANGLPYAECDGQQARFLASVELGDVKAADAALAAAHRAARTTKSQWTVAFMDSARALLAGRLDDAEAAAVRSREAAIDTAAPPALAQSAFVRLLSCIRLVQGRLSEHEPARRAMAQDVTRLPVTFFVVRAQAARERDDPDGAREAFGLALDQGLLELPRGPTWTMTLTWAADVCAWLADRAAAARLHELLDPFPDVVTWQYGPVARSLGLLELALGRRPEAERRLRQAIEICERMDARAFLAMARLDLATSLAPSAERRRLLEQARGAADELGMPGLTSRALAATAERS